MVTEAGMYASVSVGMYKILCAIYLQQSNVAVI